MQIDLTHIAGTKGSKTDNFALMCSRLIAAEWPQAKAVDGKGGDQGLDTYIGVLGGKLSVFQFKYFCDRIRSSQRAQIKRSLKAALKNNELLRWTLVLPIDMNIHEQKWFQSLSESYKPLHMDWWGETKLRNLLSKYPEIAQEYFEMRDTALLNNLICKQDDIYSEMENLVGIMRSSESKLDSLAEKLYDLLEIKPRTSDSGHRKLVGYTVEDIIKRSRLAVLVWGPGKGGDQGLYRKRVDIRDKLRELGHRADFSEDILDPRILYAGGINLSVVELLQAKGYEYIVCLMSSPGSIGEVHDFCRIPELAHKMTICIDRQHLSGYSGLGALQIFQGNHGNLMRFSSPDDLTSCDLMSQVIRQVENRAAAKQDQIARSSEY